MSLLDDNIIIDPIPSLITRYLIDHTKYILSTGIILGVEAFYKCNHLGIPKLVQVDYDDQPENWYLMKKYTDDKVYITKWIGHKERLELNLHALKHSGDKHYTLITLKDVLDELA